MTRLNDFKIRLAHNISNMLHSFEDATDNYRQETDKRSPIEFNALVIPGTRESLTKDIFDEQYLFFAKDNIVSAMTAKPENIFNIQQTLGVVPYVVGNLQAPEEFFELGESAKDGFTRRTNRHIAPHGYSLREVTVGMDEFDVTGIHKRRKPRFFQETALHDLKGDEIINPAAMYLRDGGLFVRHNPESQDGYLGRLVRDAMVSFYSIGEKVFEHNTRVDLQLNKTVHNSLDETLQQVAKQAQLPEYEGFAHQS